MVKELSGSWSRRLADGNRASTHELQSNRWHHHFSAVLNCLEPEENQAGACILDVNTNPIMKGDVLKATHRVKNGKAAGIDHI